MKLETPFLITHHPSDIERSLNHPVVHSHHSRKIKTEDGLIYFSSQFMSRNSRNIGVFPSLVVTLSEFGFNVFGDMLRDVLGLRLRMR